MAMLFPDITELDFGSYRGSFCQARAWPEVAGELDQLRNSSNAPEAPPVAHGHASRIARTTNYADMSHARSRGLRHNARHGRFSFSFDCKEWQTNLLTMAQQCYHLRNWCS